MATIVNLSVTKPDWYIGQILYLKAYVEEDGTPKSNALVLFDILIYNYDGQGHTVAYDIGSVNTDVNGSATLKYKLPASRGGTPILDMDIGFRAADNETLTSSGAVTGHARAPNGVELLKMAWDNLPLWQKALILVGGVASTGTAVAVVAKKKKR